MLLDIPHGRERREHKVFMALLKSVPGLEERLMSSNSEEEIHSIAAMVSLFLPFYHRNFVDKMIFTVAERCL